MWGHYANCFLEFPLHGTFTLSNDLARAHYETHETVCSPSGQCHDFNLTVDWTGKGVITVTHPDANTTTQYRKADVLADGQGGHGNLTLTKTVCPGQ